MSENFLHGVEVLEIDDGIRTIRTVRSSVIGVVGTAPNSQPEIKATATVAGLTFTALPMGALGNQISIKLVDSAALSVTVTGRAITVNLATDGSGAITSTAAQIKTAIQESTAAEALVSVTGTGSTAVAATFRPVFLTGGADEPFPLNVPVLVAGDPRKAALLGSTGTLPDAMDGIFAQTGAVVIVVRVAEGTGESAIPDTLANVVGGVGLDGSYSGVWALLTAESVVGFCPRILIAPGFTSGGGEGQKNPVVAEFEIIAARLRAVAIADGQSTTDAQAIADRRNYGNKRVYFHDVDYLISKNGETVRVPASSYIAGVIARTDNELGFWHSPSNKDVFGIIGLARPIDFTVGDSSSQANLLNENEVATTIRSGGFKLWGNRTTSTDSKWAFLSVVRTADLINDSILRAHMWAVDRNITKTYYADVVGSVNAYLSRLKNIGAIAGGLCWVDKTLNTAADIAAGRATIDFDFGAYTPAERLTFRSKLNQNYLEEIV